jgi:hypothetical protein
MTRPMPPSGADPPLQTRTAAGEAIDLVPLAQEICRRYSSEFPDEEERYGPAGHAWCLHDNQYLLAWAIQDARDHTVDLAEQVVWLADVLNSRGFPIARLARDLEIAAAAVSDGVDDGPLALRAASKLTAAAATLRHAR